MDFDYSPKVRDLQSRVTRFMEELKTAAKEHGLWSPTES